MKKTIVLLVSISSLLYSCIKKEKRVAFIHQEEVGAATLKIIDKIIDYGEITNAAVGYSGKRPKQWDNFMELTKQSNEKELLLLIEHPHPVVKCYAFDLLIARKNNQLFQILEQNMHDTSTVFTQYGCSGDVMQVNDYFIDAMLHLTPDYDSTTRAAVKAKVDSILLARNQAKERP